MDPNALIPLLDDPRVVEALRHKLGLPSEPVAAALRSLEEAHARTERKIEQLIQAVDRLVEAQARTEQTLERLAAAQAGTDRRLEELVAAQTRTDRLVAELVAAQARTDRRLEELVAAQARTDRRLEEMAAQTDARFRELAAAIEELSRSHAGLRQEVGALSQSYGFTLEDIARTVLPGWLERHLQVRVESLEREFVATSAGEEEIDLFATGRTDGQPVSVVGEAKSRLSDRDVDRFLEKLGRLKPALGETRIIPLLFGFVVHPRARSRGRDTGVHVVATYDR